MSSVIRAGEPYSAAETAKIIEGFNRDGYYVLGPTLEADEVEALRGAMQRKLTDPRILADPEGDHSRGSSLMRMFEYDSAFRDLIVREPFPTLAEAILGENCQVMSQNALYSEPGQGGGWHLDDLIHFPVPDGVERHDPRLVMPCFVLQIFVLLTDVEAVEYGPTQVVPGSQYAGRRPHTQDNPTFEGRGPVSIIGRAGDAYLFNNQVWHQGALNTSDRTRFLAGVTYSKRFIAQRFYPFIDYRMPEHVWEGASPRLQRFLGRHDQGSYG
jgi:hypothetical protein